jgi:hypothetical protein
MGPKLVILLILFMLIAQTTCDVRIPQAYTVDPDELDEYPELQVDPPAPTTVVPNMMAPTTTAPTMAAPTTLASTNETNRKQSTKHGAEDFSSYQHRGSNTGTHVYMYSSMFM